MTGVYLVTGALGMQLNGASEYGLKFSLFLADERILSVQYCGTNQAVHANADFHNSTRFTRADAMNIQTDSELGRTGDKVIATAVIISFVIALAIGVEYGESALAGLAGAVVCLVGLAAWRLQPGTNFSRYALTTALVLLVALHIQLGRGTLEFHFGVFVTLGLLMVYMDWRPILLAAVPFCGAPRGD